MCVTRTLERRPSARWIPREIDESAEQLVAFDIHARLVNSVIVTAALSAFLSLSLADSFRITRTIS